jgi:hypothetical protein
MDSTQNSTAQRFSVELDLDFKCNYARDFNKATVKNISTSGALIQTDVTLKPAEKINVYFKVSGRERKISARVVWVGENGAGVCFDHFNNRDLQIVDDLIYFATEKTSSTRDLLDSILNKVA